MIPFAVYEVITNHPLLREVEYESFEEVGLSESKIERIYFLVKKKTLKVQVLRCFTVMNDALGEWENSNLRRLNFVNCHVSFTQHNLILRFLCHIS